MRILLAEDEIILSDALSALLEKNGFSVDAVYDGLNALGEIRKRGNDIPVLMLTAKTETSDKVAGLDCGADDYLTKPFSMKELLARLRAITRRGTSHGNDSLRFSDIELRRSDRMLICPGGSHRPANKEYQILEYLLLNHDRLISTEHFMEMIWGYESDAELNVVWVNISGLRRGLSELEAHVRIKAVRETGYILEEVKRL